MQCLLTSLAVEQPVDVRQFCREKLRQLQRFRDEGQWPVAWCVPYNCSKLHVR